MFNNNQKFAREFIKYMIVFVFLSKLKIGFINFVIHSTGIMDIWEVLLKNLIWILCRCLSRDYYLSNENIDILHGKLKFFCFKIKYDILAGQNYWKLKWIWGKLLKQRSCWLKIIQIFGICLLYFLSRFQFKYYLCYVFFIFSFY